VPVWSHGGIICTGETYKAVVKLTFAKGASLPIPPACSTPASTAIRQPRHRPPRGRDDRRDAALKALIRSAVALNTVSRKK
jgi:hypothetical protein